MRTAFLLTAGLLSLVATGESAKDLLVNGIFMEEVARNLPAAIELYHQAAERRDSESGAPAEALYRLGQCQLRAGHVEEARATFRKLIGSGRGKTDLLAAAAAYAKEMPVRKAARPGAAKPQRHRPGGGVQLP